MDRHRWLVWGAVLGCGGTVSPGGGSTGESSSSDASSMGPSEPGLPSSGQVDDDSSSSSESSDSTGREPSTPLRALLSDLEGESEVVYLVETDGIDISEPVLVHGPAPAGVSLIPDAISGDLIAVQTTTLDDARSWVLIEVAGTTVGASAPLVLAPAPMGHVEFVEFVPEDGRAIFAAAQDVDAPRSLWSTTYAGSVAQPPERVSPPDVAASYEYAQLSEAGDAVLAKRVPEGGGAEDLVWMPHAPADPDAAIVVADHDESWQTIGTYRLDPEGVAIRYTARVANEDRSELFVDDLDPGTPPVLVHPDLPADETISEVTFAPNGEAVAYWAGVYNFPMIGYGDVFVAPLAGASVGTISDASDGDDLALRADLAWSPDSRWITYERDDPEATSTWIVRVQDGIVTGSNPLEDSGIHGGTFDPQVQHFYYVGESADELLRVDLSGDIPGAPEVVSDVHAEGSIELTDDGAWLGLLGRDPKTFDYAAYVLQPGMPLPTMALRVDPLPEPGAQFSTVSSFSRDQRWVLTDESIDLGVPALVHATSLEHPGTTITLGRALQFTTLPDPER